MISTSACPLAHPDRLTISWMIDARFGVLWSSPAAPTVAQTGTVVAGGAGHATEAAVPRRVEICPVEKSGALSAACPWMVSTVVSDCTSFAVNWTYAFAMAAPRAMGSPAKRIPTVWFEPSKTSSRSLLVRDTEPVALSSASSLLAATRTSTVLGLLVVQDEVSKLVHVDRQPRVPPVNPWDWQVCPARSLPSQVSAPSRTPLPQVWQPVQLEVLRVHEEVQLTLPPVQPRLEQVAPPRSEPSHCSLPSRTPFPQVCVPREISYTLPSFSFGSVSLSTPRAQMYRSFTAGFTLLGA